ncbi:MAG TPA: HDOD domain-containing protein [Fimbriimonadaceae bacterium]|nr:HDOD domain-containing protein [Fimbriimonadaceae bacterium]
MYAEDTAAALAQLTLDEVVEKTPDLPALPAATLAVMRESQSATSTAHSVARYLSQDQSLTARVLRLANSAFYGMQRRIASPDEAVIILGMRAVRNLAMIASTYHWMDKPLRGYALEPHEFWEHSLSVAVASQVLAQSVSPGSSDLAFTCGLLHDLGKVALSAWLENRSVTLNSVAARLDLTTDQAERRVLGFDHQQVGGKLAEKWNLPKVIVEAISYHHCPSTVETESPAVDIVHVADYMASTTQVTTHGGEGIHIYLDKAALDRLMIGDDEMQGLSEEFAVQYENYEKLFIQPKAA